MGGMVGDERVGGRREGPFFSASVGVTTRDAEQGKERKAEMGFSREVRAWEGEKEATEEQEGGRKVIRSG